MNYDDILNRRRNRLGIQKDVVNCKFEEKTKYNEKRVERVTQKDTQNDEKKTVVSEFSSRIKMTNSEKNER